MSESLKSLTVDSIGICVASPAERKKPPCLVVAYSAGRTLENVRLLTMKLPKKELYTREDILSAIASAERVRSVSYPDYNNEAKDIYVCRPSVGESYDVFPRDERKNRFEAGFAEIESDFIKFGLDPLTVKIGKRLDCRFFYRPSVEYERDSYEFAAVNAYNACLLGRLFSRDEFHLETGDGTRAKYEVRTVTSKYVDLSTLYVKPIKTSEDGVVEYYVTEPILEIDGDDMSRKTYKIIYVNAIKDYSVNRFD